MENKMVIGWLIFIIVYNALLIYQHNKVMLPLSFKIGRRKIYGEISAQTILMYCLIFNVSYVVYLLVQK